MSERPRVFLHWNAEGWFEFGATGDVEIVCIDTRTPHDRVYRTTGQMSDDAFDAEVDARIREPAP